MRVPLPSVAVLALVALAVVAGCGDSDAGSASVESRGGPLAGRWSLRTLVAPDGAPTRPVASIDALFADGSVSGRASVNTYRGGYDADGGGGLAVGPLASTRIAGSPEAMAEEAAYLAALEGAASYRSDGRTLTLFSGAGAAVLAYEKDAQTIVGSWEVTGFDNGRRAVVSVAGGSAITAAFGEDGTLAGSGGVNRYRADFATSAGPTGATSISISPPASTRMAGPPELGAASAARVPLQNSRQQPVQPAVEPGPGLAFGERPLIPRGQRRP